MDNNQYSGPPMAKIDGVKARRIREQKGLTQLYVATVVGVTTDTISRWENRRYPSIKQENAEKLAEALEVELEEILDIQAGSAEDDQPMRVPLFIASSAPKRSFSGFSLPGRPVRMLIFTLLVIGAAALAFVYMLGQGGEQVTLSAYRVLPAHVPPGQTFPVMLQITSSSDAGFSLIIRENLPEGCDLEIATPPATGASGQIGQVKWVSKLEGSGRNFAYLIRSPKFAGLASQLEFTGYVVAGRRGDVPVKAGGSEKIEINGFHWADINRDNMIDDEEILVVYDLFSDLEELAPMRDKVDEIWAAGGYKWDLESGEYIISPDTN